ncbi:hypothetical protein ACFWUZ_19545 [Streptomyces sp. NPDC058646]|uniref:hypothetical protein n=1 Tax=Streptomyces sp. NPDC058646 TaxID=3346574 RepID=UPI0036617F48
MTNELTRSERIEYGKRQDAAYQEGEDAVARLAAALVRAGVALPSLRNDGPVGGHGFVHLGGCNAALADRLAEVIAAGARALEERSR